MALKTLSMVGCSNAPQLGGARFQSGNSGMVLNLRYDLEKCRKWECCCLGVLAQKATTPVEDEKPNVSANEASRSIDGVRENESKGFLNLLPSELYSSHIFPNQI